MRLLLVLLLLGLAAACVWSFVDPAGVLGFAPAGFDGWFPREVGRGSERVDRLFDTTNVVIVVLLVLTSALLAWTVWRGAARRVDEGSGRGGHKGLELLWTAAPAAVLVWLVALQLQARDAIAADGSGDGALEVGVDGAQFEWRFRYPGPDGVLDTVDDPRSVGVLALPTGRPIVLRMVSSDVIHSFFVPSLRMKRDVVPGATTELRFVLEPDEVAAALADLGAPHLPIACAELCGWGHAAMVGRLVPLSAEEFDAWSAARAAEREAAD